MKKFCFFFIFCSVFSESASFAIENSLAQETEIGKVAAVPEDEQKVLLSMHRLLAARFLLAVHHPAGDAQMVLSPPHVPSALSPVIYSSGLVQGHKKAKRISRLKQKAKQKKRAALVEEKPTQTVEKTAGKNLSEITASPSPSLSASAADLSLDDLNSQMNALLFETLKQVIDWMPKGSSLETLEDCVMATAPVSLDQRSVLSSADTTREAGVNTRSLTTQAMNTQTAGLMATQGSDTHPVATQNGITVSMSTQAVATQGVDSQDTQASSITQDDREDEPKPLPSSVVYTEALDPRRSPLEDAQGEMVTLASLSKESYQGWHKVQAPLHWPTVSFMDDSVKEVPLLHQNTLLSFQSQLFGQIAQHTEAGIAFGELAPGWSVSFSKEEGSQQPLYFNEAGVLVSAEEVNAKRQFVILNVKPGADLLYFTHLGDWTASGSVAVPVLAGHATFVNLSQINTSSFTGQLLSMDGSRVISGASVQVVGQGSLNTQTDENGRFEVHGVLTVGQMPTYLETEVLREEQAVGFKHRYSVSPARGQDLSLYRVPSRQVRDWSHQIEHGLSPESGLIFGAVPSLFQSFSSGIPVIRALSEKSTLAPETYILDQEGALQVMEEPSLTKDESRFLGAELPEGLAIAQVTDKDGQLLWGELVISSPGVISMVGSYE